MQVKSFHNLQSIRLDLLPAKKLPANQPFLSQGLILLYQQEHLFNPTSWSSCKYISFSHLPKTDAKINSADLGNALIPFTGTSFDMSIQNLSKYWVIKVEVLTRNIWQQGLWTNGCRFFLLQSGVTSQSMCGSHSPTVPLETLDTSASFRLCCHAALPAKLLICVASALRSWWLVVTAP